MTLALQILLAIVVLAGLITTIMTVKSWHWAQMLLLLGIFLSAIGTLILGLEVYRIHRDLRAPMPGFKDQLAEIEAENDAFIHGTGDLAFARRVLPEPRFDLDAEGRMPSQDVWTRRLQEFAKVRGRVWRGVTPAGQVVAATGQIPVAIPQPQPHGLAKDAIVYVFEQGEPNAANPPEGAQYLGEFRVMEERPEGALLEAVIKLDNRTGNRLARSEGPWTLYQTMPADRHELYEGLSEDELRQRLPAASVEEYVRHGQEVARDFDDNQKAMFDEQGRRLGPEGAAQAVKWTFDRSLRDYGFLFADANRILVGLRAAHDALTEDIKKLRDSDAIAKQLGALRTEELQALAGDLEHLKLERSAIESLQATIAGQLANARKILASAQAENVRLVGDLTASQQQMLQVIDGP